MDWFKRFMRPHPIDPIDLARAAGTVAEYSQDTMDAYVWDLLRRLAMVKTPEDCYRLSGEAGVVVRLIQGLQTTIGDRAAK